MKKQKSSSNYIKLDGDFELSKLKIRKIVLLFYTFQTILMQKVSKFVKSFKWLDPKPALKNLSKA